MTAWDLFAIAIQRWVVTVFCVILTASAAFWAMKSPPVYLVQDRVVLLPPAAADPNGLTEASRSVIDLAGVVARAIEGSGGQSQPVSDGVTLTGEGIRSGYSIRQPNSGGQWKFSFDQPVLDVQAVDATPAKARAQMQLALDEITKTLTSLEDAQGTSAENRARMSLNPATPQISEQDGSRPRAIAASIFTGAIVTLALLSGLGRKKPPLRLPDRRTARRSRRTAALAGAGRR
jgi:hypothetical protein